ncbi:MAG TPA: 30S ribosomal protein S7 [Candidatus Paceibacterota bacterium]|nr:30S ribosomal protein S7 [Candidatus Paceibacterota bacterium]
MEQEIIQEKNRKESDENKIFKLYSLNDIIVVDLGLKNVINLDYKLLLKSHGRNGQRFGKTEVNIIERLINYLGVPGHRGKKHKVCTSWSAGKYNKNATIVLEAFKLINEKTGKNPIQVLVSAVEKAAPRDEITTIQYGGARYPQAVDCAPYRRVSIALRNIVHGSYDKSFNKKKTIAEALADELIATSNESGDGFAYGKRNEIEKQADGAR